MALYQQTVADIALYNEWKPVSKHEDQHACTTTGKDLYELHYVLIAFTYQWWWLGNGQHSVASTVLFSLR